MIANGNVWISLETITNSFFQKWFLFGGLGNQDKKVLFGGISTFAYKCPQCNEITLKANS